MGHNSVANVWRMTIYNLKVDLVYDVYTKFVSISLLGQKLISDVNQGPLLCCKFAKNDNLLSQK